MDRVKPWREVIASILLAVETARVLIGLGGTAWYLAGGSGFGDALDPWGYSTLDLVSAAFLLAAVWWCLASPPTRHARSLAAAAAAVIAVSTFFSLVTGVRFALTASSPLLLLAQLLTLVPAVLLIVVLLRLRGPAPAADRPSPAAPAPQPTTPALPAIAPDPQTQPTWTVDEAQGTAWHRAGDAAHGGAGSGWSAAGGDGWNPVPQSPPPEPRAEDRPLW